MGFSAVAGGIADAIGGGLVADAIGTIGAGALYGAGGSLLTGGDPLQGALMGGLTGGLGGASGSFAGPLNGALSSVTASLGSSLTGALFGGALSGLTGGDPLQGALMGGIQGGISEGWNGPNMGGSPATSGALSPSTVATFSGAPPIDPGAPMLPGFTPSSTMLSPSLSTAAGLTPINSSVNPLIEQAMATSASGTNMAGFRSPSGMLYGSDGTPVQSYPSASKIAGNTAPSNGGFLGNGPLAKILGGKANGGDYLRTMASLMAIMNAGNAKKANQDALRGTSGFVAPTQISYAGPGLSAPDRTTFAKPRSISAATMGNLDV